MPITDSFPLRRIPRPPQVPRRQLRPTLRAVRDLVLKLLRNRATPEVVADAALAAARVSLAPGLGVGVPGAGEGARRSAALLVETTSEFEAFAGAAARAGVRLARQRARPRRRRAGPGR